VQAQPPSIVRDPSSVVVVALASSHDSSCWTMPSRTRRRSAVRGVAVVEQIAVRES
jgi:hypothetical protein